MSGPVEGTSGTIEDVTLSAGQGYTLVSGGAAYNCTILSGGYLYAESGGKLYDTVISNSGGPPDGYATDTTVYGGGTASGTLIYQGGEQDLESGGKAYNTFVYSGGEQVVDIGTAYATTISSGGVQEVGGERNVSSNRTATAASPAKDSLIASAKYTA